ncbi:MAG: hypothetical protein H6826_14480 [Planctomycetes bacterium]|nr:hypothetical protein [Planctomycetota bacterium]
MTTTYTIRSHHHSFELHCYDFADELERPIVELFETLAGVVPPWCRMIHCNFLECQSPDSDAECSTDYDYRSASLRLGAAFFKHDEGDRVEVLLHELLHIATAPIADLARSSLTKVTADYNPGARDAILDPLTGAIEQTVQDLTFALLPLFTEDA